MTHPSSFSLDNKLKPIPDQTSSWVTIMYEETDVTERRADSQSQTWLRGHPPNLVKKCVIGAVSPRDGTNRWTNPAHPIQESAFIAASRDC